MIGIDRNVVSIFPKQTPLNTRSREKKGIEYELDDPAELQSLKMDGETNNIVTTKPKHTKIKISNKKKNYPFTNLDKCDHCYRYEDAEELDAEI